jgi:hypothetical protein
VLGDLRTSKAGILLAAFSLEQQLALVDTAARRAVPIPTGLLTHTHAAGWLGDGSLIFGGHVDGRIGIFRRWPDGRIDLVKPPAADSEIPLIVLGDDIVYGRFPGGERTYPYTDPAAGDVALFRRTPDGRSLPLGISHRLIELVCAGDRAPPCFLLEAVSEGARAVAWDPRDGRRGAEAARWQLGGMLESPALSPDGRSFARPANREGFAVIPTDGGPPRPGACAGCGQLTFLTFDPQGSLLAAGLGGDYRLIRIGADGGVDVLLNETSLWMKDPRVSPDGRSIAVLTADVSTRYLWVAAPER